MERGGKVTCCDRDCMESDHDPHCASDPALASVNLFCQTWLLEMKQWFAPGRAKLLTKNKCTKISYKTEKKT